MTAAARSRVAIAPGGGLLVRRPGALLYVPAPDASRNHDLVERFVDADQDRDAVTAVTDAVVAAGFDVAPFVIAVWADQFEVLVHGAVEVRTDHPSLPMMTGAGSTSWVERRVPASGDTSTVEVTVGDEALAGTDVGLGSVLAGGLRATLVLGPRSDEPAPQATPEPEPAPEPTATPEPEPTPAATPEPAPAPTPPAAPASAEDVRLRGLDALQVATGGDWMEDSLGLGSSGAGPSGGHAAPPTRQTPTAASPPATTRADPADHQPDLDTGSGPGTDDEVTLAPEDLDHEDPSGLPAPGPTAPPLPPPDEAATVPARRCALGHPNPLHALRCRACGAELDDNAPIGKVPQPTLAALRLADGRELPIDRTYLLGRAPDVNAAHAEPPVTAVEIGGDAAVSRTHATVSAEQWTITVTDCGSRSGTAVIASPGDDPVTLDPWVPHEVPVGATIYLGGPTSVSVAPCAGDADGVMDRT